MSNSDIATHRAVTLVPGMPADEEGPVFSEPWEAQAFAMAVSLQARGIFSWSEWSAMLGEEIRKAQEHGDSDTGSTYYLHWLATLERMVIERGLAEGATLIQYHDAWEHAANRTPHGTPIELKDEDFSD